VRPKRPTGALTLHAAGPQDIGEEVSHGDARCTIPSSTSLGTPAVKAAVGANVGLTNLRKVSILAMMGCLNALMDDEKAILGLPPEKLGAQQGRNRHVARR
jgi:hypothetical protein